MKKKQSEFDRFVNMSAEELALETAQFDSGVEIKTVPVTAEERRKINKFYARVGRPRHGRAGTKVVAVSIEKSLLARFDRAAKKAHVKRSEIVARAFCDFIAAAGA